MKTYKQIGFVRPRSMRAELVGGHGYFVKEVTCTLDGEWTSKIVEGKLFPSIEDEGLKELFERTEGEYNRVECEYVIDDIRAKVFGN